MKDSYWELEDGLWYYYGNIFTTRYKLNFDNKSVIEQYNLMGNWEDGNSVSFISFPPTLEEVKLCVEDEWETKQRDEEDFEASIYKEIAEEENLRIEKRDSWKKKLKGLINTKRLWEEMKSEMDYWDIEGVVEIVLTDEKIHNYPDHQCAKIKNENHFLYMKTQPDYGIKYINHYYVWQTTGYSGDDYSGYLLYPLKNGKYLKISYAC